MWQTIVLGFLGGLVAGNGLPAAIGVSVLLIGLFHAGPGAFGRKDAPQR
ncbi:hypothetical protein [Nonomuraea sediminis]|nr:hypothetical protein [Nonomuraea sediminis]